MSVTAPRGFVAAGVSAGIKGDGKEDLALVATESRKAVPAAAVFTSNLAAAAPVLCSRAHLAETGGRAAGVVINSGNANAATGKKGREDAERTCKSVGTELGAGSAQVLVCSTGLIGIPLPVELIEASAARLVRAAGSGREAAAAAARAIMTTDTRPKEARVTRKGFEVGGMAKGAAMLAPDMATMLAVLTTDAALEPADLDMALRHAVDGSFNRVSVDGATSTNDTVVVLANGLAGPVPAADVASALEDVSLDLAGQMAGDAEGATRVVIVEVTGARSFEEARIAARKVADSLLVKCSLHGADPYWGRIVSELGTAGVGFDIDRVSVAYGGTPVCREGVALSHDRASVEQHMKASEVEISCDLGLGEGRASVLSTDLGHGYIDENMGTS